MSAPRSKNTKELLKAAKLPERSITLQLRGDLVAEIEEMERELAEIAQVEVTTKRMVGNPRAKELAALIEAKREEMADALFPMRLRALTPNAWRDLLRKHPPKKGQDTLVDVLPFMGEALPLSVISPDDMDSEDWETLQTSIPTGEMTRLINTVWELNTQGADIPKSLLASVVNRPSDDA